MVFSVQRLENHHPYLASLHDFRAKISNFLSQILLNPENGSEKLSLEWIQKCFAMLDMIHKAFGKLVVEIDYPMSSWGGTATEEFLKYSLRFLDLLNSVSSSLSELTSAKISLLYALSLVNKSPSSAKENLQQIQMKQRKKPGRDFKAKGLSDIKEKSCFEKELVILEALLAMKSIGFWVLDTVLSGLRGDSKPPLETRILAGNFNGSIAKCLNNSRFCKEMKESLVFEEVKKVNDAAMRLVAAISTERSNEAAKELKGRLEVLGNSLQGIEKQTNLLFSQVLATRDQLLDSFRLTRQQP